MATMNFNTTNSTFRQLLGNGLTYRVPPFQRDYSWADDEWDDLWQDITGLSAEDGESSHYMGYLVLQSSDSRQFSIIDGQQRLTTISVIILAALSHLKDLVLTGIDAANNSRRKEQLQNSYIGYIDPVSLIPRSKLELNAFKVFETLNARGVRLSATELLKNYLFSVISTDQTHETELKAIEDRWERITGLLGSESFPEFLRVFWNSRNKLVRKTELFKTIRKRISARDQAFELLRDLDQAAAVYAALRDPQDATWNRDEKQALDQLLLFNVRQPLAMLMACQRRYFDQDRAAFTKILKAIAVVSFRYNVICNLQTHDQERLYSEIAWKLSSAAIASPAEVIASLSEVYPEDNQFKAAFAEKEFRTTNSRNKKVVRYILFEIERQRSGQDFDFESATYNLEHILPEHPSECWDFVDESKQERLIYRIGNMTPLETSRNRDVGNGGYAAKRDVYRHSAFRITRAIAEHYETWDEQKIESRQSQLATVAAGIWKIDFQD